MLEITPKGTVLLVDDEHIVRESLREWLELEGFKVVTAADGFAALDILKKDSVNVGVLDIRMPGMDGVSLLEEIIKTYSNVAVIMMTAHATVESAVECMRKGAYDYVIKPFPPEKLTNIIDHVLALQNLQKSQTLLKEQFVSADIYLKRAERLMNLGKFAATTSFNLNVCLVDLQKKLDNIAADLSKGLSNKEVDKILSPISYQIKDIVKLTQNIEKVTDSCEPIRKDISLNDVVRNSLLLAKRRPEVVRAHISLDLAKNLPLVNGRLWSLVQVCNNLLYNAVRATQSGQIELSTGVYKDKYAFMQIKDHGCGIKEKEQAKLFNPFYCGWEDCEGIGLGLIVSKSIVESFSGCLKLNSEYQKGTTVRIELPVARH